jgi:hypothetical protein
MESHAGQDGWRQVRLRDRTVLFMQHTDTGMSKSGVWLDAGTQGTGNVQVSGALTQGRDVLEIARDVGFSLCGWCPQGVWAPVFTSATAY